MGEGMVKKGRWKTWGGLKRKRKDSPFIKPWLKREKRGPGLG